MVAIDIYRGNPDTIYAIGDSIIRSTDRGRHWQTLEGRNWGTDIGALKVDPTNSQILYLSKISVATLVSNDQFMSTDGGIHWKLLFGGTALPVAVIEIDPLDPKTVYVGAGPSYISRTTDRGQTWTWLPYIPGTDHLTSLAIAPTNDSILYAGFVVGGVFRSTDKGSTWTQMPFISPLQAGPVLSVDPRDANVVYAAILGYDTTQQGGIFKSTDGGVTWIEKNNGLRKQDREVFTITINPRNPDDIFIGTGSSDSTVKWIFRTNDGGEHWFEFSDGFPHVGGGVQTIAIDTLNNRMYAGVISWIDTQGIYILDSLTTGVNPVEHELPKQFFLVQNYPNPFNPTTSIGYSLSATQFVSLKVYDLLGREVAALLDGRKTPGTYEVQWNAEGYPSGVYFYRLQAGNFIQTKRMILIR